MRTAALLLALAAAAAAQEVSRSDLARAYLRFEEAFEGYRPDDLGPVSRGVDRITQALLAGDHPQALRILDDMTAEVSGMRPPGLRVRPRPRVVAAGARARLAVERVREDERRWILRVHDRLAPPRWEGAAEPGAVTLPPLPAGHYVCELADGKGSAYVAAELFVSERPLEEVRRDLLARCAKLDLPLQARAAVQARIGLLVADPPPDETIHVLTDPLTLAHTLALEVALMEEGGPPWRPHSRETWCVAARGGAEVPLRIYAPRAAAGTELVPLVVALHGAGGDENLFFHGLGRGRLKALAEEHGFVAVTPLTYPLAASPALLDAVLELATDAYRIDPRRVYLLGHSLGAMTAAQLAAQRTERFAAVACIAGGGLAPKGVPLLLVGGGEDPLFPPWRLKPVADAARTAGADVEMRVLPHLGHTLVVGEALPETVAWLLKHEREKR